MTEKTKEDLDYIIHNKQIKTVFQPIISLRDGSILGYEALSRITCKSKIENPEILFNIAQEYNRLWDLELLCRTKALEAAYKFMIPPYSEKLFINVNPNMIHDETFKKGFTRSFLKKYKIMPQNIIFEITERNVIEDMDGFKSTINNYKEQDYKIAIDDAGAGYSGLNLISEVNPNYIKLDMKLIRDINSDPLKFALVKGMVEFSKISNIAIIAEGIETYEELNTLVKLEVHYGQGYLIQRPDSEIFDINQEFLQRLDQINLKKNNNSKGLISNINIASLCTPIGTISQNVMVSNVFQLFKHNQNCLGLCVVDNQVPIGIVTREKLALKLSGYYGFSLNQNKKISHIIDKNFLSIDYKTPISVASSMAMSRENDTLYDFIVVTKNDKYLGVVTIKNLLEKISEIKVLSAKNQNPLSGLDGNLIIDQKLNECIKNTPKYSVAYLDIDNFKAYNDVYGFENGDLVLKLLANILKNSISDEHFIGHIGGDDFVIIIKDHITVDYLKDIVKQFEDEVIYFYNQTDIQNGYLVTNSRHGEKELFPLITLTCVVVNNQTQIYKNIFHLTERLAVLKKRAKTKLKYRKRDGVSVLEDTASNT